VAYYKVLLLFNALLTTETPEHHVHPCLYFEFWAQVVQVTVGVLFHRHCDITSPSAAYTQRSCKTYTRRT